MQLFGDQQERVVVAILDIPRSEAFAIADVNYRFICA